MLLYYNNMIWYTIHTWHTCTKYFSKIHFTRQYLYIQYDIYTYTQTYHLQTQIAQRDNALCVYLQKKSVSKNEYIYFLIPFSNQIHLTQRRPLHVCVCIIPQKKGYKKRKKCNSTIFKPNSLDATTPPASVRVIVPSMSTCTHSDI